MSGIQDHAVSMLDTEGGIDGDSQRLRKDGSRFIAKLASVARKTGAERSTPAS